MLPTPLRNALSQLASVMEAARDEWWVISGAAAALHGASPIEVEDVDVLTSVDDARRILPALGLAVTPGAPSPLFRSAVFGSWRGAAMPIEFMAGFRLRTASGWIAIAPATRVAVAVGAATVHIPAREELIGLLEAFGRPKDLLRARLLRHPPQASAPP